MTDSSINRKRAPTPSNVEIKEVHIEHSLNTAGDDCNHVIGVLIDVAVDPVEDVQRPIEAKSEEVVRSDGLRFTRLGDHMELRQDGYRFKVDWEGP